MTPQNKVIVLIIIKALGGLFCKMSFKGGGLDGRGLILTWGLIDSSQIKENKNVFFGLY